EFILGEKTDCPFEVSLRRSDGTWLDTETLRTNLLHDESVQGIVLNTRDITERKAFLNQLEHHAFYDSLTGLANRALFRDRVNHALSHARRASIGVAYANGQEGDAATEELLRNADIAMYVAKNQGKGRCEVYQPTTHKTVMSQVQLRTELQRALENDEFVLHYQPLVTLETERISGLEALVRWQHPERGLIPPLDFIPLAEESGLIIPLGRWVLQTACKEARRLQHLYPKNPPLSMSVNLSARQLQSPTIVADVREAIEESGIEPSSLTLEVTESAMMKNIELSVLRLRELRDLQVRIAIDDFGAGYSSLGYIRQFPVDILKVDKSFIARIDEGDEELALAAAIIDMAKVLKLRPVAEGVERIEQLERLVELGCDTAQGYYFARPGSQADVENHISGEHAPDAVAV